MSETDPVPAGRPNVVLDYAHKPPAVPSRWGKGFLSLGLTLLLPGLGQFLAGFRRRGAIWFGLILAAAAASLLVVSHPALLWGLALLIPATFLLHLVLWIDAWRSGRRSDRRMLGAPAGRYAVGAVLIIVSLLAHPLVFISAPIVHVWTEAFIIHGQSMAPALQHGDRVMIHKRRPIERWSIIVYRSPMDGASHHIMRLVGLPGETVEIIDGQVHIDGRPVVAPTGAGPYESDHRGRPIRPGHGRQGNPIALGEDEYYVLGDNSDVALDSRYWDRSVEGRQAGTIGRSSIEGPVTAIHWPPARWQRLDR